MICRACSTEIQRADVFCPNCGSKTGVQAKSAFKWSLGCSGIGCSVAILAVLAMYLISSSSHYTGASFGDPNAGTIVLLGFLTVFAMGSAFIGLILALVGFTKKNYKLTKKK